jgi:ATP-dependent 26S proteasome regulatory subunit
MATNRIDILDDALLRPGRIDRKIEFPNPNAESRAHILKIHSRKMNLMHNINFKSVAEKMHGSSGAECKGVCTEAGMFALRERRIHITQAEFEPAQNIKVLMATNRIDILDDALLRPGRIDRKIEFPNPNAESRAHILKIHSRKMNLMHNINFKSVAEKMHGSSGAECKGVCTEAGMFALRERRIHITQAEFEPAQNIKVLMATNRIDILDDALLRPGRIDRKIEFPNPNAESRAHILKIHSRKMNLMHNINFKSVAEKMHGSSGAECKGVCTEAGMFALRERRIHITQADFEPAQNIKVLMATNRIDILDDALLRPGRIDRKIEFPNPNAESRAHILKIHSRKMNLMHNINFKSVAEKMHGSSGAECKGVCTEAGMFALRERRIHITQAEFEPAQNIKVLMATNRIDILDDALLRPGRIDRKIEFPNPNAESRAHILKIHSRKMNLMHNINFKSVAEKMHGSSGAECKGVCTEAGMFALRERRIHITQADFEMAVAKIMKKDGDGDISKKKLWK